MPGFGDLDWSNWLYGLFAGFIGGGAGAVVSGVAISMMDPKDFSFGSGKFFVLVGTIFVTHGSISAFMFLKQQPLPSKLVVTTVETTVQQSYPTATVKTTVAETKSVPDHDQAP